MRIFEIINLEFKARSLRAEESIEEIINDKSLSIEERVCKITDKFEALAINELAQKKCADYLPSEDVKK